MNYKKTVHPWKSSKTFLTDKILDEMVELTNIYVKPHIAKAGTQKEYSKLNERKTVTVDKVRIYITLLIYTGILWEATYENYYTDDPLFTRPFVK